MNWAIRYVRTYTTTAVRGPLPVEKLLVCGVYGTLTPMAKGVQRWVYQADSAERNATRHAKRGEMRDDGSE